MHESVIILDFGSQYTQLIARKVREQNVYCEIYPFNVSCNVLRDKAPKGIILSGGPQSIYEDNSPRVDPELFSIDAPFLGICYGMGIISQHYKGLTTRAQNREYGRAKLEVLQNTDLFSSIDDMSQVWMSHGDRLEMLPEGFEIIGRTSNSPIAAIRNVKNKMYAIQFHPEVHHSVHGSKILGNFLFKICKLKGDWTPKVFVDESVGKIKDQVGNRRVVCGLSGGVDSSVTAALLYKAIGSQLMCVFIDNGLLRSGEREQVAATFRNHFHMDLRVVDGRKEFLRSLSGVTDPEKKRKIIGKIFINLFENEAKKIGDVDFLAQGTLYPDLIESISFKGPSATIKSHHNVGGLPEKIDLKLVEPLRELFKDEVRKVGKQLDIPDTVLKRHPFPGPGLAIRILGAIDEEKLELLRSADKIFIDELNNSGIYDEIWQALTVLLPVRSVGVMGDHRTYERTVVLRAVTSVDGMTADWYPIKHDILARISNKIINEVKGVNRVVYDVSSKPPGTIEWE